MKQGKRETTKVGNLEVSGTFEARKIFFHVLGLDESGKRLVKPEDFEDPTNDLDGVIHDV